VAWAPLEFSNDSEATKAQTQEAQKEDAKRHKNKTQETGGRNSMSAVAEHKQLVKGGAFLIEEREPETIFTPEDFTDEHRMIAETTRQFIDNEVNPRIDELEKHDWKLSATRSSRG